MATGSQDRELGQDVFELVTNYDVDDVYDKETILTYVSDNHAVDEVFDEATILGWVSKNYSPEDVFDRTALDNWADTNRVGGG